EAGGPAGRFERCLACALERLAELAELALARGAVEAPDTHVDRMDLPAADDCHEPVPGLLQLEPAAHRVRRVAGELDRAVMAQEVRSVEHVHVQRVALDPLAAVEEPAQQADGLRDLDAAEALEGVHRARLVGDGTDAADARGDVGSLAERAPPQHRLEEARRLEDAQLDVLDVAVAENDAHRAFALDTGQVVRLDGASARAHGRPAPARNGAVSAANVLNTRSTSRGSIPRNRSSGTSAPTFGVSIGPKQPKQPRANDGHNAPQPECVTGPRHGVPCATVTQTTPRCLHSVQTLVDGISGLRPWRNAVTTSSSWRLSIGQPCNSKSTSTCAAIGVDVA